MDRNHYSINVNRVKHYNSLQNEIKKVEYILNVDEKNELSNNNIKYLRFIYKVLNKIYQNIMKKINNNEEDISYEVTDYLENNIASLNTIVSNKRLSNQRDGKVFLNDLRQYMKNRINGEEQMDMNEMDEIKDELFEILCNELMNNEWKKSNKSNTRKKQNTQKLDTIGEDIEYLGGRRKSKRGGVKEIHRRNVLRHNRTMKQKSGRKSKSRKTRKNNKW